MTIVTQVPLPRIEVGAVINNFFTWLTDTLGGVFDLISTIVGALVNAFIAILEAPDPVIMIVILGVLAFLLRGWRLALGSVLGLLLVACMEQWSAAMQTLALVLVATIVAVVIAVPLGILAASKGWASAIIRPLMDLMQTMPAFVWLVPVVTLFSIGVVPGVVATIIFALPPGVRLTELGIRGVDSEIVEAAHAFGATGRQTLFGVQLPLALTTIMAGVNQVIMLALSMAVISGLVGAEGLGGQVSQAISTLDLGLGFEAGLSVVILAIYLDRLTGAIGQGGAGGLKLWPRKGRATPEEEEPADADATVAPAQADTHTMPVG